VLEMYQSRPATMSYLNGQEHLGQLPSGAKILRVDRGSRGLVSQRFVRHN